MASGSPDYWMTKSNLISGVLSDIKAANQEAVDNLDGTIGTLKSSIDELVGVHEDTTAMIAFGSESWSGSAYGGWVLVSDINVKRNMLRLTITGVHTMEYSRDGGATTAGSIASSGTATFHDSPGVWVRCATDWNGFDAYEEWAT